MPFGMRNAPATFQRLINTVIADIPGCEGYIDDVIIYSEVWTDHLRQIRLFFDKLRDANLTVNLSKSAFGHAQVHFLGHVVGGGEVKPITAKVDAINNFPVPSNKKELMRFLGMAGYYRRFCKNFSVIVKPLTDLLHKDTKFNWVEKCQVAFEKVKAMLMNEPILCAPNFQRLLSWQWGSDIGAGAVLLQEDITEVERPVCYFSKKFEKGQKNYCTSEKELLALVLALQHFEVYVSAGEYPLTVYTDHNPLTFLQGDKC